MQNCYTPGHPLSLQQHVTSITEMFRTSIRKLFQSLVLTVVWNFAFFSMLHALCEAGNWTRVFRVTGGNIDHYPTADLTSRSSWRTMPGCWPTSLFRLTRHSQHPTTCCTLLGCLLWAQGWSEILDILRVYWASLGFGARKTTVFSSNFSSSSSFSSSSFSSKRDRLGCSSQKTFWSKSKATPPTLFSIFLNLETLTSIKSVKNSFSVKSGGLRNYKLLIRKPLLTCQFSQETCLIVFYYQKEKLRIWMVVRKLCLMYMLVRNLC